MAEQFESVVGAPATSIVEFGVTRDGLSQLRREWPVDNARAVIVLVHGIGEHSGRYEHLGGYLASQGFGVVGFDQRGFGRTGGARAHVHSFEEFATDVEDHLAVAAAVGVPTVVCGHSMGGLVATSYLVSDRPQPDLAVLSGPALATPAPAAAGPVMRAVAPLAGYARFGLPLDGEGLSRDPAVGVDYETDPLVDTRVTPALLAAMFESMAATTAALDRLTVPTLVIHGGEDRIVPTTASEVLAGRPGVERIVYEQYRHEIFNEIGWQVVADDVVAWLTRQGV